MNETITITLPVWVLFIGPVIMGLVLGTWWICSKIAEARQERRLRRYRAQREANAARYQAEMQAKLDAMTPVTRVFPRDN